MVRVLRTWRDATAYGLISGVVRLAGMAAWGTGFVLRLLQFGNVQGYSFVFGLGVVGLIYYVVFR